MRFDVALRRVIYRSCPGNGAKADSTLRSSQAVPHPSTNRALCCLTSEVKRDPVHSTRYGRRREIQDFERILKTFPQMEPGACEARVRRAPCRRPAVARPRREKDNRAKHPEHKTKNTRPDTWRRTSHPAAKQLTTTSSTTSNTTTNTTTYVCMSLSFRCARSRRRTGACITSAENLQSPFEVAGDKSAQFSRGGNNCDWPRIRELSKTWAYPIVVQTSQMHVGVRLSRHSSKHNLPHHDFTPKNRQKVTHKKHEFHEILNLQILICTPKHRQHLWFSHIGSHV